MEITEIRVYMASEEDERLKAYVTITFNECFVVRDLKIISGTNGLFVAMPSKKRRDGSYKDIAHPITPDFRQKIERQVIEKYQDETRAVAAGLVRPLNRDHDDDVRGDYSAPAYEPGFSTESSGKK